MIKNKTHHRKYYNIISGVNGAGKTSPYESIRDGFDLGVRINIDEIVSRMGDWRDALLQIRGSRVAVELVNRCIDRGLTFNQETTVPGPLILRAVERARSEGYTVRLFYVGIESVDLAVARVMQRVAKGGHGIDDKVIRNRFEKLPNGIRDLYPLCDSVLFFDNTKLFRQIALIRGGELLDCDNELPHWFRNLSEKLGIELPPDE